MSKVIKRAGYTGRMESGVEAYLGIQYAQDSHLGRFTNAVPSAAVKQLAVATSADVPIFPQLPSRMYTAMGSGIDANPQQESAFFLNVWAPSGASMLPVLVFIHGGAWMTGAGTTPWYDGQRLSTKGLVVVTLNYRLGPLAHLTEEGAGRERNPAYQDILTALTWVQENIAIFGGDPDRVTVAGQSAGSWYAHLLNISADARGLFTRTAYLSHSSKRPWSPHYQDELSMKVQQELNVTSLKTVSSTELLEATMRVLRRIPVQVGEVPTPYLPTTETEVADIFCSPGDSARLTNSQAVYLRTTASETAAFFFQSEPELQSETPYEELVALSSETFFAGPARKLADAYADRGLPTYLRSFTLESNLEGFMSGHCFDLPFQFGSPQNWADAPMLQGISFEEFEHVSERLVTELSEFVIGDDEKNVLQQHKSGSQAVKIPI